MSYAKTYNALLIEVEKCKIELEQKPHLRKYDYLEGKKEAYEKALNILRQSGLADQPAAKPLLPTVLVLIDKHGLAEVATDRPVNLYIRDEDGCKFDEGDKEIGYAFNQFWDTFPDHFTASDLPDLSEVISTHKAKQS